MKHYFASLTLLATFFLSATNASAQWKQASGFSNSNGFYNYDDITGFAVWGNSILAHASCGFDGTQSGATGDSLFLSTDNGQTWTGYASNGVLPMLTLGSGSTAIFYANTAPAGTNGKILSYSNDGAMTWITDTTGLTVQGLGGGYASSVVAIGSNVFMSDGIAVYKQTTLGAAWATDTTGLGVGTVVPIYQVGRMFVSGNNLILSTGFTGLFQSANGGSWSAANNGLPSFTANGLHQWYPVDAFAVSGSSLFAQVPHDTNNLGGADLYSSDFYRSQNNGSSWTKMNSTPIDYWGSTLGFTASSQALFTVTDSGFYASTDNGATWTKQNQGLPSSGSENFFAVTILGGNVVIGTQFNGAYYRALSDFGGASVGNAAANSISLSESYPNPVNSTSKINYSLATGGMASLTVFDITGKQIAIPVSYTHLTLPTNREV